MTKRIALALAFLAALAVFSAAPASAAVFNSDGAWTIQPHPAFASFVPCPAATDYPNEATCAAPPVQREFRHRGWFNTQTRRRIWYYLAGTDAAHQGFYVSRWTHWRTVWANVEATR